MGETPARTEVPTRTRIFEPSGTINSVRDPKRIIPNFSPCATTSPTTDHGTMRRAIAPVICRTPTKPMGPSKIQRRLAFFRDEAGSRASKNSPFFPSLDRTVPETGERFT